MLDVQLSINKDCVHPYFFVLHLYHQKNSRFQTPTVKRQIRLRVFGVPEESAAQL